MRAEKIGKQRKLSAAQAFCAVRRTRGLRLPSYKTISSGVSPSAQARKTGACSPRRATASTAPRQAWRAGPVKASVLAGIVGTQAEQAGVLEGDADERIRVGNGVSFGVAHADGSEHEFLPGPAFGEAQLDGRASGAQELLAHGLARPDRPRRALRPADRARETRSGIARPAACGPAKRRLGTARIRPRGQTRALRFLGPRSPGRSTPRTSPQSPRAKRRIFSPPRAGPAPPDKASAAGPTRFPDSTIAACAARTG